MKPNDPAPLGVNIPDRTSPRVTPAKPAGGVLLKKNLLTMADWYRAKDSGPEVGLNITAEIVLRDIASALDASNAGKEWQPPT